MNTASGPASPRILQGVRVLDCGRFIAAPYCGVILAEMGAEVIRVERPGGEVDRRIGLQSATGENFVFPSLAHNKKGITLNVLGKGLARQVLSDLVSRCDVFLHNFSPAAATRYQLDYQSICSIRPDIIYTGVSCYGAKGPCSSRIGFDPMAQMMSGAASVNGVAGELPMRSGVAWVDYSTGLCAALGTILALRHRDATGDGQAVDCSLLQTAVSYMAPIIAEAAIAGLERPRLGNQAPYLSPCNLYACQDGFVYIATITMTAWRSLACVIGHPDLGEASDLKTPEQRFAQRARLDQLIEDWTRPLARDEIVRTLDAARVPCGVYLSTAQILDDPQVQEQSMLQYVDLGVQGLDRVPVSGLPITLSSSGRVSATCPPRIGEHNLDIYGKLLGYDSKKIACLEAEGAI